MDLLLQYNPDAIKLPVAACDGAKANIFSSFFESCVKDPALARYLVGYSFDLSEDRELPGIYLLPPGDSPNVDHVPAMLAQLGAADRLPSRPGAPTRLGFYLGREMCRAYREDKALLKKDLSAYYRRPIPGDMLDRIFILTQKGYVWDFQFDLFPDGDLARALGVSVKDEAEEGTCKTVAEFTRSNMPEELGTGRRAAAAVAGRLLGVQKNCFRGRRNKNGGRFRIDEYLQSPFQK